MDAVSAGRIKLLHPAIRDEVYACAEEANKLLTAHSQMRVVQGLRTFPEQHALFLQRPKVTNADAGQSYHNYGLAIDFCLLLDGQQISWDTTKDADGDGVSDWMEVVKVFEAHGYTWGKAFNDLPHFEKNFGLNWRELLHRYNEKDFITGTTYVRI